MRIAKTLLRGTAIAAAVLPSLAHAQVTAGAGQNAASNNAASATSEQAQPTAAPAAANDSQLQDIIVTATKTGATRLQSTPLPISAFTADQLSKTRSMNVKDLAQFIPSVVISQVTTNPVITIRGIGTTNVGNGSDPDVTEQVDGVYIARPSAQTSDFLDIERVEVLRGPQGTLYGRNAVGGTINIISRAPTDTLHAEQVLTGGNYGLFEEQTYIAGPIIPGKLQASAAVSYTRHNNYEKNIGPSPQKGVNNGNHGGARVQLRFEPTDTIDATTRADYSERDETLEGAYHLLTPLPASPLTNTILGDYSKVAISDPSTTHQKSYGVSEDINIALGDNLHLKSITAFRKNSFSIFTDNDGSAIVSQIGHMEEHEKQKSQEFNLNGKFGRLDLVTGLYYFDEDNNSGVYAKIPGAGLQIMSVPVTYSRSEAVFGQGAYHLANGITFTAGVRYTKEKKRINVSYNRFNINTGVSLPGFPVLVNQTRYYHALTPKFGIDWQIEPNILLYATATRGYKSGGVNYAASSNVTATFNPEHIWSYEAGAKTELFDRRLRVNVTAFHYDYNDLQIQSTISAGVVAIANAAQAKVNGFEAEVTARITPDFHIDGDLSLLSAKYKSFPSAAALAALAPYLVGDPRYNQAAGTYNATDNRLNSSPRSSGSVAAEYDYHLASGAMIYARADVFFQARVFYDASNSRLQSQGAYHLFDASIGFNTADERWKLQLWSRNLADKRYLIATLGNGLQPAGLAGNPRTFGGRISYSF